MKAKNLRVGASRRAQNPILLAAVAALPLLGAAQALAQTSVWTFNGSGNWSTPANWNNGEPNSATSDVTIDDGDTAVNVSIAFGQTRNVRNLTIGSDDQVSINDNAFLIIGGSTISNSGTIAISSGGNATDLNIATNSFLTGGGTISLQNNSTASRILGSGARLTNFNNVIMGRGLLGANTIAITNLAGGLIDANVGGAALTLDPMNTPGDGTTSLMNSGVIQASNSGILVLNDGTYTNSGVIQALTGSEVQLVNGVNITGGSLNTAGNGAFRTLFGNSATLSNLTNAGRFIVNDNSTVNFSGTITNNNVFTLQSGGNNSFVNVVGTVTLGGTGSLELGNSNNRIGGTGTLVIEASQSILGGGGVGNNSLAIINNGLIDAGSVSVGMGVDPGAGGLTNKATLQASNRGILVLNDGTYTNTNGVIQALNAGSIGTEVQLQSGVFITGGSLNTTGNGVIRSVFGQTVSLDNLTNAGRFIVNDNSTVNFSGTITNNNLFALQSGGNNTVIKVGGTVTLNGNGSFDLNNSNNHINGAGTLVVGAGQTILGGGAIGDNTLAVINDGLINAGSAGVVMTLDPGAGGFLNTGTLQASNQGVLRLSTGTYTNTNGVIQALNAGAVGTEVQLINNPFITGGSFNTTGNGAIRVNFGESAAIDNLINAGRFIINDNATLNLSGTITNNNVLSLESGGNATRLNIGGDVVLNGTGSVVMSNSNNRIGGSGTLTLAAGHTIAGGGAIGVNTLTVINNGLINAGSAGVVMTLDPSEGGGLTTSNSATLQASNGGALVLSGNGAGSLNGGRFFNNGTIRADDLSQVQLVNDAYVTGGTITSSGSGNVRSNSGNTVTLADVTHTGSFVVSDNSTVVITGLITNNGSMLIDSGGNATYIKPNGSVTLTGGGILNLSNTTANWIYGTGTTGHIINDASHTIRGSGNIGFSNLLQITNKGLIEASSSNGLTLTPNANNLTNTGTLNANGGPLSLSNGLFINTNGYIRAQGVSVVQLINGGTISGGTLQTTESGVIRGPNGTLQNITNTGSFTVPDNSITYLQGTITDYGSMGLESGGNGTYYRPLGSITLQGTGVLEMSNSGANWIYGNDSTGHLVHAAGHTIRGAGNIGFSDRLQITNAGLIQASLSNGITIDPNANGLSNTGTLSANGGTLRLSGSGGGSFTNTGGYIVAETGSNVDLINGVVVSGGTLDTNGTGVIRGLNTSQIRNLTNTGSVVVPDNNILEIAGTIINYGSMSIESGGNATYIRPEGAATLSGNGVLALNNNAANWLYGTDNTAVLTNDASHTIRGSGNIGFSDRLAIVNLGLIEANQSTQLLIHPRAANLLTNTGTLRANGGQLTMEVTGGLSNFNGGTLTGGAYEVFANSTMRLAGVNVVTNNAYILLDGLNSDFFNATGGSTNALAGFNNNLGTFTIRNGRDFTTAGTLSNSGWLNIGTLSTLLVSGSFTQSVTGAPARMQLSGGTFNATGPVINSVNGTVAGFGRFIPRPTNHGLITSSGGALAFSNGIQGGSGTVQATAGSGIDLSSASTFSSADYLLLDATGTLSLGANDFQVSVDYVNANSGVGNSFNPRANVTGTGQILATPAVQQAITGDVGNGGSATANMDLGNIRVGNSVTRVYQVNNLGATGPVLRGAIQTNNTAGNGGNITDARLSGSGVTAQNFGPIANNSATSASTVTFNGTTAGALSGQQVAVVNNFDNVPDQTLTITGAAYNPAVGALAPASINFGNYHVGDLISAQTLTISNTAPAGAFSEDLRAQNITVNGDASTGTVSVPSSINVLASGTNNSLPITLSTASAGAKAGSISMNFISTGEVNGTTIPGLGTLGVGSAISNFTANVYQLAIPSVQTPINLGQFHVGSVASGSLAVSNAAPVSPFSESLNANVTAFNGDISGATGSATFIAGGNSGTSLNATINTSTAGNKSGTATIQLTSIAGASGLSNTNLANGTTTVTAQVFNLAAPQVLNIQPINFGIVHTGDSITQQGLQIKNNAASGSFSENLNSSFGTVSTNITNNSGTINGLAAQSTNSTNMRVGINTASHAVISGNVQVLFQSDGAGINTLGQTTLAPQVVNITGQVNDYAAPLFSKLSGSGTFTPTSAATYLLDFGTVGQNSSITADLRLLNNVIAPADNLAGAFLTSGADYSFSGFGAFAPLAPGGTLDNLDVTFITSTIGGPFTGSIVLSPRSQNANFDGALGNVTINITGTVVPEPTSLMSIGVAGLLMRRRRRR